MAPLRCRIAGGVNGRSWLEAGQYDPDLIEADLTQIAALNFNLVDIQYSDFQGDSWAQEGRALIDFLERCRNHGIWVRIALPTTLTQCGLRRTISPTLESYLQAAYLPGNDRVFAYELLWEPMIGTHDKGGKGGLVNGALLSTTPAAWFWIPTGAPGSTINTDRWPTPNRSGASRRLAMPAGNSPIRWTIRSQNDGPWRIMVAAYRRFLDDYLGRNLGVIARQIRRSDPDTLLTYRNWTTMTSVHNDNTGYDIGAGAAHLDFFSPERYAPRCSGPMTGPAVWSPHTAATVPAASRCCGPNSAPISDRMAGIRLRARRRRHLRHMMRQVADDGSNGASVWWWPGGSPLGRHRLRHHRSRRHSARLCRTLAQWNATFAAAPPDLASDPSATLTVDRDADARGSYGLFLNNQDRYVQARQAGQSVVLADQGTGTDTSTMPLIQVGNVPYDGRGSAEIRQCRIRGHPRRVPQPGCDGGKRFDPGDSFRRGLPGDADSGEYGRSAVAPRVGAQPRRGSAHQLRRSPAAGILASAPAHRDGAATLHHGTERDA